MAVRIGELLLKEQRITAEQLQEALDHQASNGGKLGYNLVKLGFVQDEDIAISESVQVGMGSMHFRPGLYAPRVEQGKHHFHRLVAQDTACGN